MPFGKETKIYNGERVVEIGGISSTYTSAYKPTQPNKTTGPLVILGTIYSTKTLAGDANIGIIHSEIGFAVVSNQNDLSRVALIGPDHGRRAVLSGQDFVAKPLDLVVYARSRVQHAS
jgi:hypothetical protein